MATYYEVLRVKIVASQMDIDRAYQRMVKESSYDTSINRKEIELAYRTLRDPTQRTLYDYSLSEDKKQVENTVRTKKKTFRREQAFRILKQCIIALFVIVIAYWAFRYGYQLKSFSVGDEVYDKSSNTYLGKVIQVQDDHNFGAAQKDACLLKTKDGDEIWLPLKDMKSACYKK